MKWHWESSKYFWNKNYSIFILPQQKKSLFGKIFISLITLETILEKYRFSERKFFPYMKDSWHQQVPTYLHDSRRRQILKICDLEVMSDFEDPYMKELAKNCHHARRKILNIGFGLGIVDSYIEERRTTRKITEHHIIELNEKVFQQKQKYGEKQQSYKREYFPSSGRVGRCTPSTTKTRIIL